MQRRLLLGSGGMRTKARIDAWVEAVNDMLGDIDTIYFVPYALADHAAYHAAMVERFEGIDRALVSLHNLREPRAALYEAPAVFVGGGNTWRLLREMYRLDLLEPLRARVESGMPYLGVSAGSNVACPTILTTNDMPIALPPSPNGLGLVPFQINAHYFRGEFYLRDERDELVPYAGETRDDRLREFHEENDSPILALWEGAILQVNGRRGKPHATLRGPAGARWFQRGHATVDLAPNADVSDIVFRREDG